MKKFICDFCNEETAVSSSYIFPILHGYNAKDIDGNILYRLDECKREEKDVCPECERKIASLLELIPKKIQFNDKEY